MKISILATCFNNQLHIREFSLRTVAAVSEITTNFEVLIVDDGSTDDSWKLIDQLSIELPQVRGIRLSRNFGQHPAILAGLDEVQGDLVVLMDSDLDDDPQFIPQLVQPILDGHAEIVLTSQVTNHGQHFTSRLFHSLIQRSTSSPRFRGVGTYRAFSGTVLAALRQYRDHSSIFGPLSTQIGFTTTCLSTPPNGRLRNPSNYNFRKRLRLSMPMLINEAGLPLKLVVVFTAVMCVLVFGLGFIAATRFLSDGGDLLSTTTLVFLVLVINQALLGLGIALVATYARATLRETLRRPRYHIAARSSESDS